MTSSLPSTCHPERVRHLKDGTCQVCYERNKTTLQQRVKHYKRVYGLTLDEVRAILASQGNRCAICHTPVALGKRRTDAAQIAHLDHDHKTGKVRGILCISCNSKLDWYIEHEEDIGNYLKGLGEAHLRV